MPIWLGPRRSDSVASDLREARAAALVAVIALVAAIVLDAIGGTTPGIWSADPEADRPTGPISDRR